MKKTGFMFLKLCINDCHDIIRKLDIEKSNIMGIINEAVTPDDINNIVDFCVRKERKLFAKQREKHYKKLCSLLPKKNPAMTVILTPTRSGS